MHSPNRRPTILRLGLTGGIGSGKSTVATFLSELGAAVVDADDIARKLTAAHGLAMPEIAKVFGNDFVTPQGALDRERMRAHVFADTTAKQKLEAIIHPLVTLETQRQAQVAVDTGRCAVVFDIPLLVESGRWRSQVDRVLVVDCPISTQIQRVMVRNQFSTAAVEKIIAAQATRMQRLAVADWVIYNEHLTLDALQQEVGRLPITTRG